VVLLHEQQISDEVEEFVFEERRCFEGLAIGKVDFPHFYVLDQLYQVHKAFGDQNHHVSQFIHESCILIDFALEQ